MQVLRPTSLGELQQTVAEAYQKHLRIEIIGQGSKRGLGHAVEADIRLETSALAGIEFYEPEELTLRVKAGTPLKQVIELIAACGQQLAFEPAFWGGVYGQDNESATVGGLVACNACGPRRVIAGSVRDALMGIEVVSGYGEIFHSGGRVMKNVTGFDLVKLMCGAHGTLGVLHSLTLQTVPVADSIQSVVFSGLSAERAGLLMRRALGSDLMVTAAAYLPTGFSRQLDLSAQQSTTLLRIEGPASAIQPRLQRLRKLVDQQDLPGEFESLAEDQAAGRWQAIRDLTFFHHDQRSLFKISLPSDRGPELLSNLTQDGQADAFLDWGGSLLWLAVDELDAAKAEKIRHQVAQAGGHATLFRCSPELSQQIAFTHPQPAALTALSQRVRSNFDPRAILNPGRIWPAL